MRKFDDRIDPFCRIETGMRGSADRADGKSADTFTASFNDSSSQRRFKDKRCSGSPSLFFNQPTRGLAADLFITGQKQCEGSFCHEIERSDRAQSLDGDGDPRFHVEDSWTVCLPFSCDMERPALDCSEWPDRIEMADDQDTRRIRGMIESEVRAEMGAIAGYSCQINLSADGGEQIGGEVGYFIKIRLGTRTGFALNELADQIKDGCPAPCKMIL